ncbi:mannuronan 5-epimerase AlgG [Pseudomonas typographi]|uniref:mannuronan 5-epimerase n=1 Tax=Pseudomonas typographi TaxID=2715964 RepID=A0ABR7YYJ2_9PSED|nr:mannuronan 5-epimerase AlgG [Pseudomonas typographi]MBD1550811.1 right-handed parallel beta-helix repeat-containing protein [Pseudomonas typographi]MBD1587753.1 right-handed parallel beta-helix repeat-containing protein [Pseudomonas typographi]MBD1598276.1 right-handed parallel beta-helix repeat-containing protein [Pseudomonas typographi]
MKHPYSSGHKPAWPFAALAGALLLAGSAAWANPAPAPAPGKPGAVKELQEAKTYNITAADAGPLAMAPPKLPDLSGYTVEAAKGKVDRSKQGKVAVRRMMQESPLKAFIGGDNKLAAWVGKQRGIPVAIFIDGGYMNFADLAKTVPKQYLHETAPGIWVARVPIVVSHGATLEIDGRVKDLRLSQDGGSFLVNDGKLFTFDTKVTGWSEAANRPSTFKSPDEFRPFLVSWGGTETYLVNTVMASMGYNASKSYGVSISQYTPSMKAQMNREEPTGWIIGSTFSDMWYGYYCYETRDFVVKSNTYKDNVIYGIDPHDRSHGLIIADNDVYGTHKKHGIIVSREVDNSFIINNRSHGNNLSGVVLDRNSVGNVVAYNEIYQNDSDGITLYESGDNLIWGNKVLANKRHGIRVRNSTNIRLYENIAMANKLTGVYGHIKDLSNTDRDIKLDPFDAEVSLILVGGQLSGNGTGPLAIDSPLSVELYKVSMLAPSKSSGITFNGVLGDNQAEIMDLLVRQQKAVLIDPVERQSDMAQD